MSGTLTFNMTHASERGAAARKSRKGSRIAGVEKFVGSRFTLACNTSRRSPSALRMASTFSMNCDIARRFAKVRSLF